jgi:hypothetical protein
MIDRFPEHKPVEIGTPTDVRDGLYHRFREGDNALQLKDPSTGLFHTIKIYGGTTIEVDTIGEP